ncbi:tetratricopeptide repeat protein [Ruegeria sp. HKCCD8929]|uniref:tetratricopeptide repeat protein n=1 Tax=Ruegeria sp. HKCCD8929 TaxID=2683006 RepID=UPI001489E1D7|nr:tetratricopeptide repeat protein [Ruegeria sp. HKCCD8929]
MNGKFLRVLAAAIFAVAAVLFVLREQRNTEIAAIYETCNAVKETPKEALSACTGLLALEGHGQKHRGELYGQLGQAHAELEDWPRALAAFDQAVLVAPDDHLGWQWKAHALDKIGDYSKALEAIDVAYEIDPDVRFTQRRRLRLLSDLGRTDEMDAFMNRVVRAGHGLDWMPSAVSDNLMFELNLYPLTRQALKDEALKARDELAQDPSSQEKQKTFFIWCRYIGGDCPPLFPEKRATYTKLSCDKAIDEWGTRNSELVEKELAETGHTSVKEYFDDPALRPKAILQVTYLAVSMGFEGEQQSELARDMIVGDRVFNCVQGAKFLFPEGYGEAYPEMRDKHLFSPEVRRNLVDLAHALSG